MSVINLKEDIVQIDRHFHALNMDLISVTSVEISRNYNGEIQTTENYKKINYDDNDDKFNCFSSKNKNS